MTEEHFAWGAVMTLPRAEAVAEQSVTEAGYVTWLPQYQRRRVLRGVRIENGRRVRSRSDSFILEPAPLFLGYLFVQIPHGDGGYAIDKAHGVSRLLRNASTEEAWGKPKIIRARFIVQLQEWVGKELVERDDGRIVCKAEPFKIRDDIKRGDRVRTPTGIVGELLSLDDRGRADLLSEMLGGVTLRGVDAASLERVCA